MQNKYVGDIGDYGKYSLLRALSGADDNESLRLAVVWYLRPDDKKPGGNQTGYLGQPDKYAALDPKVFNSLSKIVKLKRRNVRSVRKARLFPGEPVYFEEWVPANRKLADRREWLERAVTDVAECDLVFLDPDNGLRLYKGEGLRLEDEPPNSKHVYFDEVMHYMGPDKSVPDKSVVVIHHATPMLSVDQQIATALAEIDRLVEGSAGAFALRYHRFAPVRLFFVIPADRDRNLLFARAAELCRVHGADFSLHTREQAAG
ncbi:MAG: hypothetical protein IIA91_04875, partial [Chloroflexi bacterium]|nr:hypothetical protein [Chloroflexota bacterium]